MSAPADVDDTALALATLGHGLAPHIRERARAHVERMQQRGDGTGCDPRLLELVVAEHLRPLPENREWLTRHGRVRRRLHRDAQHDLPATDRDPVQVAADRRILAARSAWYHLHKLGLGSDVVTHALEVDLAASVEDVA